ncbi:MAG: hypothetical protein FWD06_05040 [Oscillospiraceae bacterium]|nr:hypothetical protein [Oscillospiraceae bacterium]
MKKILCCIFAAIIMAMFLAGCSSPQNHIRPANLTSEQRDLLDFITTHNSEILLFDFATSKPFETIEFWLETYEYGVLVDSIHSVHVTSFQEFNRGTLEGQLAVLINSNRENGNLDFQYTFIVELDGTRAHHTVQSSTAGDDALWGISSAVSEPVYIQNGSEIILYLSKFSGDGLRTIGDLQDFAQQPELLAEYPYVHMIKARFSR